MSERASAKKQRGISVILVIFILVVVGGMVVSISRLVTTQQINSLYSARGAQTYFAARAGLDYAIARINSGAGCGGIGSFTLDGFSLGISCAVAAGGPFDEGNVAAPYNVFILSVVASAGTFAVPDVVNRRVRATVRYP